MKCTVCGKEFNEKEVDTEVLFAARKADIVVCRECAEKMLRDLYAKRNNLTNAFPITGFSVDGVSVMQNEAKREGHLKTEMNNLFSIVSEQTPEKIKQHLDKYIIGQESAKKTLSVAVYNHYKRLAFKAKVDLNEREGKSVAANYPDELQKSNIIMLGPSGSGKTAILKAIAKYLDVPFAITDASSLTEAGYVGSDPDTCIRNLWLAADKDVEKTERGIVFLDEFDKLARKSGTNRSTSADPGHEGVQQALLKIIEGDIASITEANRKHPDAPTVKIDTSNILFVCGGAFEGIEKIIDKRVGAANGFGLTKKDELGIDSTKNEVDRYNKLMDVVKPEDLKKYGILPEMLGRLPIICRLHQLKKKDLIHILTKPKNAIVKQFQVLFAMDGCKLRFDKNALEFIAENAIKNKTGARALRTTVEDILLNTMYDLPSISANSEEDCIPVLTVTKESVKTKKLKLDYAKKEATA